MSRDTEHAHAPGSRPPRLLDTATLQRARRRIRQAPFQPAWRRLTADTDAFLPLSLHPPGRTRRVLPRLLLPAARHRAALRSRPAARASLPGGRRIAVRPPLRRRVAIRRQPAAQPHGGTARPALGACRERCDVSGAPRRSWSAMRIATPHYPVGPIRTAEGNGRGKATHQSLDEATLIVRLARCYDLVATDLSEIDRHAVERGPVWRSD